MKKLVFRFVLSICLGLSLFSIVAFSQNRISGIIFDHNRRPVSSIRVELLDNLERLVKTQTTNSSGLYMFSNIRAGVYYINIVVGGTGYVRTRQRIDIGSTNRVRNGNLSGAENLQKNFYLQLKRGAGPTAAPGVVFVQNVPKEAQDHFESAIKNLKKNRQADAENSLRAALEVFPDFFNANLKIAGILYEKAQYQEALPYFVKAHKVHPKSFTAAWGLATTRNALSQPTESLNVLERAIKLKQDSAPAHLLKGIILRKLRKIPEALEAMLEAKKFARKDLSDLHYNLALLYFYDFKEPGKAADELELFLKSIPKKEKPALSEKMSATRTLIKRLREMKKKNQKTR